MTRRSRAGLAVAAIACVVAAVPAQASRPRREIMRYEVSDTTYSVGAADHNAGVGTTDAGYYFEPRHNEKAVSVMLLDDNERPVAGIVAQYVYDGGNENVGLGSAVTHAKFCGRTEKPVKVDPDLYVQIHVVKGACNDGTPSAPTSGDIVVDFHRR
jgi:hypothetical protein